MASTNRPDQWWLNWDQEMSAAVRGAAGSAIGRSVSAGERSVGHCGVNRVATSANVARSATMSTDGGREVSEAATKSAVTASPISASTSHRRRAAGAAARGERGRTERRFNPPSKRSAARRTPFASSIQP